MIIQGSHPWSDTDCTYPGGPDPLRGRIRNHVLGLFSPTVLLVTEGIQESPGTGQVRVPKME